MTAARRRGKPVLGPPVVRLGTVLLVTVFWTAAATGMLPARAATTERIVTNPRTGIAIDGFDPVAYFVDDTPRVGRPDFEFRYRGAVWRFCNSGNQAAFAAAPADYEPRFGGYDPIAIGRGAPTPGNPEIWLVAGRKLYLFYSLETKNEFGSDPARAAAQADAKWPDVLKVLAQ
jgi:YHS domain-containing protein